MDDLKLNLCLHCRRRLLTCVCKELRPFDTNSRFIILMHPMEFKKEKVGTGRFSHLILKNSEVIVDVGFDENERLQEVLNDSEYETFIFENSGNGVKTYFYFQKIIGYILGGFLVAGLSGLTQKSS